MVRGDDRNVPDATRWGERATFEPTTGLHARSRRQKSRQVRGGGEDLHVHVQRNTGILLSLPLYLTAAKGSLSTLSGA